MRVLHYGLSTNPGGIEHYLLGLAQQVDPERFAFDFVYNRVGEPCFRRELAERGSHFYAITPRRESPRRNRQDLDRLFGTEAFDLFHCHVNTLSYVEPIYAALRHGCPVLVHSHNAGASGSHLTTALHRFHRLTFPRDRVTKVAVSKEAGMWLFGRGTEVEVVHNGIDTARFAFRPEARARLRATLNLDGTFAVGHIGAFLPAKNHGFLVSIFHRLSERIPEARLLLVGAGPLEPDVRSQVSKLGLDERVHFLGRRSDVPDLLSAMDCLAFPSLHEGLPLAVLEAQASGLPCVISDAITDEVVVTETCTSLDRGAPPEVWVRVLMDVRESRENRHDGQAALAPFSVAAAVERMQGLYLEQLRR